MSTAPPPSADCPCGTGRPFDHCCGPILDGRYPAPTAEALMRSRYTAYVRGAIDYLIETHAPETRGSLNPAFMARWSRESTWLGLEVQRTERGGDSDDDGVVEFRARYRDQGGDKVLCERSRFRREQGRWLYVAGDAEEKVRAEPVVRSAPKVGRNDPCPCGSGKKYKKCCG